MKNNINIEKEVTMKYIKPFFSFNDLVQNNDRKPYNNRYENDHLNDVNNIMKLNTIQSEKRTFDRKILPESVLKNQLHSQSISNDQINKRQNKSLQPNQIEKNFSQQSNNSKNGTEIKESFDFSTKKITDIEKNTNSLEKSNTIEPKQKKLHHFFKSLDTDNKSNKDTRRPKKFEESNSNRINKEILNFSKSIQIDLTKDKYLIANKKVPISEMNAKESYFNNNKSDTPDKKSHNNLQGNNNKESSEKTKSVKHEKTTLFHQNFLNNIVNLNKEKYKDVVAKSFDDTYKVKLSGNAESEAMTKKAKTIISYMEWLKNGKNSNSSLKDKLSNSVGYSRDITPSRVPGQELTAGVRSSSQNNNQ